MSNRSARVFALAHTTPTIVGHSSTSVDDLGRTLSISPIWRLVPKAILVSRARPTPLLAAIGHFDDAEAFRVEALQWQLDQVAPRISHVGYSQAEQDCVALASRLVDRFSQAALADMSFAAIPRGGLIVLGMLAYVLDLTPDQMNERPGTGSLVVVDDCVLSGERFRQFLQTRSEESIVFAHLYSHPDLRAAIEETEERVVATLSAHDLHDHAPESLGEGYAEWKASWESRPESGYWAGQPGPVVFAWNEPDVSTWNPILERSEPGWRLVSPDLVLKNRPTVGNGYDRFQLQADPVGSIRPHPDVVYGVLDDEVIVANVETGETIALDPTGSDMWMALVTAGDLDGAAVRLLDQYDVDEPTVQRDLGELAAQLEKGGFLQVGHSPGLNRD